MVQSLALDGFFSLFGPFLLHVICCKILVLQFIQSLRIVKIIGNPNAVAHVAVDLIKHAVNNQNMAEN